MHSGTSAQWPSLPWQLWPEHSGTQSRRSAGQPPRRWVNSVPSRKQPCRPLPRPSRMKPCPAAVLWKIEPKAAIPYLIRDLKRGNELEKKYHAFQLGLTGPDAKDALPVLTELTRAGGSVGRISAWAAELVRGDVKAAVP